MMHRRDILNSAVSAGAMSVASMFSARIGNADDEGTPVRIVDTNVNLFHWPFRRLPLDETDFLVAKLRSLGIQQAWAGSFECLLHRDIRSVNLRLVEACRNQQELTPFGSINLELPGWKHDLHDCIETFKMQGVRLHPNYHGYTLAHSQVRELMGVVEREEVVCQIVASMEDVRTQHPLVQVPDVDLSLLPNLAKEFPRAKLQVLNGRWTDSVLKSLAHANNVRFDTARVDGTDGIARLIQSTSANRVMLGTHAPFLIPEACLIRMLESDVNGDELRRVVHANANDWFTT